MKKTCLLLISLMILTASLVGCGGKNATDEPVVVDPVGVNTGAGDFNLLDPSVGLDNLQSYQQTLQTSFEGTIDGTQQSSSLVLTRAFVTDPSARLTWLEINDLPKQFFGRVGSINYQQSSPEASCSAAAVTELDAQQNSISFDLSSLPPVSGAVFVDDAEVNGIPAKHYKFDESAIGYGDQAAAKGEVWVANAGGYVLRYTLTLEAPLDLLGPGVVGMQTWHYELSEINTNQANLPENCLQLAESVTVPMLENATMLQQQPGISVYQAPGGVEEALVFYQEQAESLGWAISTPVIVDEITRLTLRPLDDSMVQLTFEPDGEMLLITVQTLAPLPEE